MKCFRTIRARLFIYYSALIVMVIVLFSVTFSVRTSALLEEKASQTVQQLAKGIAFSIDAELESMNSVANRVISSELIKDIFYRRPQSVAENLRNKRELFRLLFTASGSAMNQQIHLIGSDGRFASFGNEFDITQIPLAWVDEFAAFQPCLALEGRAIVVPPHQSAWNRRSETVISLCRAFNAVFGAPYDAIVEIQQDYREFSRIIEHAFPDSALAMDAYVYTNDGDWIYPYDQAQAPPIFYADDAPVRLKLDDRSVIASYSQTALGNLTVMVFEDEKTLLAGVREFQTMLIWLGLLVLAATLSLSYIIARQLTQPLRKLRHALNHFSLTASNEKELTPDASAYELEALNRSYLKMVERLQASLEESIKARSQEIQARMLALQAQMNPHFLYNTMSAISIKAEDSGQDDIVQMCEALTDMLRYITKDTGERVTLAVELHYLDQYLSLMKMRFGDQFSVEQEIPEFMRTIAVPKLIIQPVVENAFKHAFNCRPPWRIKIVGIEDEGGWRMVMTDNGVGFDEETLCVLTRHIETPVFDVSQESKVGLLNIYYRLLLTYKERAVFDIHNLPDGGSVVIIGGCRQA